MEVNPKRVTEKKTIDMMVHMFCRDNHGTSGKLCQGCSEFLVYSYSRLDSCPFGEKKGPCSRCEIHCYKPAMREKAQEIMRYAGPRMIKEHPIAAIRHLYKEFKHKAMRHKKDSSDDQ